MELPEFSVGTIPLTGCYLTVALKKWFAFSWEPIQGLSGWGDHRIDLSPQSPAACFSARPHTVHFPQITICSIVLICFLPCWSVTCFTSYPTLSFSTSLWGMLESHRQWLLQDGICHSPVQVVHPEGWTPQSVFVFVFSIKENKTTKQNTWSLGNPTNSSLILFLSGPPPWAPSSHMFLAEMSLSTSHSGCKFPQLHLLGFRKH